MTTPATDPNLIAALLQRTLDTRFGAGRALVALRWAGPQYVTYSCELGYSVRPEQIEQMARALGLAAGAETCRVSTIAGLLLLEIPRPEAERLPLYAERLETLPPPTPTAAALGISTGGRALWLDLADERQAHVLIGGLSGSGKSVLTKWLLYRWLAQQPPDQLAVIAADPKASSREGLRPFAHAAHLLHPIQRDVADVVRLLTWVLCEIERREALNVTTPRLLVVLEEVAHYTDQSKSVTDILKQVMQIGRGWGINVLATTQHPGAKSLGAAVVNFGATILGRVARGTQVYGAAGRRGTAADELLMRGDMLYLGAGETVRFQAPLADARQWARIRRGGPGSLDAQLPRSDRLAVAPARGGIAGKPLGPEDIDRARSLVQAGRGVEAVRQALGIGTGRAKMVYQQIQQGEL